jgi:hypothetical protein
MKIQEPIECVFVLWNMKICVTVSQDLFDWGVFFGDYFLNWYLYFEFDYFLIQIQNE